MFYHFSNDIQKRTELTISVSLCANLSDIWLTIVIHVMLSNSCLTFFHSNVLLINSDGSVANR